MARVISNQEYNNVVNRKIRTLAVKWRVGDGDVVELIDLYQAHSLLCMLDCLATLENYDTYEQARQLVSTACVG